MFHAVSLAKVDQGSDAWRAARKNGIGGSDSAAALGLSKYKTPLDLWKEKLNLVPEFTGNWLTKRGTALEPMLREHYAEKTGRTVRVPEHILAHPQHSFMIASLDGFTDDGRIQEFKTAVHGKGWGEEGSDEIPQMYLVQVQHNMIVTGAVVADVGVSISGLEPKYYEVRADQELQEMIIQGEQAFWDKVLNKFEPDPSSISEMRQKMFVQEGKCVVATPDLLPIVKELGELKTMEKELEQRLETNKEIVQRFLLQNGAPILVDSSGEPLVTWNEKKAATKLDTKALKEEQPEIYARYAKTGEPTRTFLIK